MGMAIGLFVGVGMYPQNSWSGGFTGKEFATWPDASQESFIQTSLTMAAVVLAQTTPDLAACVNARYFERDQLSGRVADIRKVVAQYPGAHPSSVIMAIILKHCPLGPNQS